MRGHRRVAGENHRRNQPVNRVIEKRINPAADPQHHAGSHQVENNLAIRRLQREVRSGPLGGILSHKFRNARLNISDFLLVKIGIGGTRGAMRGRIRSHPRHVKVGVIAQRQTPVKERLAGGGVLKIENQRGNVITMRQRVNQRQFCGLIRGNRDRLGFKRGSSVEQPKRRDHANLAGLPGIANAEAKERSGHRLDRPT